MKKNTLTKNELEIMNLLWETGRALSRSEIIDLSPNRSWKQSSIHILLNKMLEKEVIKVDGFVRTGKTYGRVYSPTITQNDYTVMQIIDNANYQKSKSSATLAIFKALLSDSDVDASLINELQNMIDRRKKELQI